MTRQFNFTSANTALSEATARTYAGRVMSGKIALTEDIHDRPAGTHSDDAP